MTSRRKFLATLAGAALVPVVPAAAMTVWKPRSVGISTLLPLHEAVDRFGPIVFKNRIIDFSRNYCYWSVALSDEQIARLS